MHNYNQIIVVLILSILIFGCSSTMTMKTQYVGLDTSLKINDFQTCINKIEAAKEKEYKKKDRVIYYLDLGMLYHYNKEFEKSNEFLTKAEYAIEELFTKSISKAAASLVLNDNIMDYSGEDYEDIYLNIFKALNYLELNHFDEAFVEIRRINNKLNLLEDKYNKLAKEYNTSKKGNKEYKAGKLKFHNSVLGKYLSMLMYRTEGLFDDARIDLDKIYEGWRSQSHLYDFPQPEFSSALKNSNKAKLNIIGFSGRSPEKKANTLYIHTEKDLLIIAETEENPYGKQKLEDLNTIPWDGINGGLHFKFQLPYMEMRNNNVRKIKVFVDDNPGIVLNQIESIEKVALETYKVKEPLIYLKTIARAVTKGLFAEKRKKEMDSKIQNSFLSFAAKLATDITMDATENADLRISRFFPSDARIAELEIEPGIHKVVVKYYSNNGTEIFSHDMGEIDVKKNRLNLLESYYIY